MRYPFVATDAVSGWDGRKAYGPFTAGDRLVIPHLDKAVLVTRVGEMGGSNAIEWREPDGSARYQYASDCTKETPNETQEESSS